MTSPARCLIAVWGLVLSISACGAEAEEPPAPAAIVSAAGGSFAERLAAKEIRRYVYVTAGTLLPMVESDGQLPGGAAIVVAAKERPVWKAAVDDPGLAASISSLGAEQYLLKTVSRGQRPLVIVAGGDPAGTLYAAYRLAEHLGVRFYMHGDVVPDRRRGSHQEEPWQLPGLDEKGAPLFSTRGIQPFHDFPEGPDWWNAQQYKAILAQLPKMGMNFFGLHTYPEGNVGPEPTVWIGTPGDVGPAHTVKFSYPARHFATSNAYRPDRRPAWGYLPMKIGDYCFGAAGLYAGDEFGPEYMPPFDKTPWTEMSTEQSNELFGRMGRMLNDVFSYARRLGVKTCIGTETPLVIPTPVKERLQAAGKDPADPAVVEEVYQGIFQRIAETHPLDYYWFWTPENWTWRGAKPEQVEATLADFRAAIAAAKNVGAPFTLATCGWVLGPPQDPSLFDTVLPKQMPMSCINRQVGHAPVETGFADVHGRPKWAIPWLEDDPALVSPQLWVGRMRQDAADALSYGCTGLMGIHWRTRILGPNVSALAKAAWAVESGDSRVESQETPAPQSSALDPRPSTLDSQEGPAAGKQRFLPCGDFYADWALTHFGAEVAGPAAALFQSLDGRLPRPSDWVGGPGGIKPDGRPWEEVRKEFAFVDRMAALRPQVRGAGNLERFDYWLNQFRYMRANGSLNCTLAQFNAAMAKVKAEKDAARRRQLAKEMLLPIRRELIRQLAEVHEHLLASVSTYGGLGNLTNWQQHIIPMIVTEPGKDLADLLGQPLPADCVPSKAASPSGPRRLFVPTVRTDLLEGERLELTAIAVGFAPDEVAIFWRPLAGRDFVKAPMGHVGRGVYKATLPPEATKTDLEYYVQARQANQAPLTFPPTAPELNQTVVVAAVE